MKKNYTLSFIAILCVFGLLMSACKKTAQPVISPSSLLYSPDTAIALTGIAGNSVQPSINWHNHTGVFAFKGTVPSGISIDEVTGKISWTSSVPNGTYILPVVAGNGGLSVDTASYVLMVSGKMTVVAGNGHYGFSGDGGLATDASFENPSDVVVDADGNIYVADTENDRIRKIDANGKITTIAGTGTFSYTGDGGPAVNATLAYPSGLVLDNQGNLLVTVYGNEAVRKIDKNGVITTVAGNGTVGFSGDGGPARQAQFALVWGKTAVDATGNIFVADPQNQRLRMVNTSGIINTVAGKGSWDKLPDGTPALQAGLGGATSTCLDPSGNLYVVGLINVYKITPDQKVYTIAGSGYGKNLGNGGPASGSQFDHPVNITSDNQGNLFITDAQNNMIRKIGSDGIITTIAGNGTYGSTGSNGPAVAAQLNFPLGLAVDNKGNLYIADSHNNRVCKVVL